MCSKSFYTFEPSLYSMLCTWFSWSLIYLQAIFLEQGDGAENINCKNKDSFEHICWSFLDEQCKSNMQLEEIAPQYDKLNPGVGFKHIEFSTNDKYIATYSGTHLKLDACFHLFH